MTGIGRPDGSDDDLIEARRRGNVDIAAGRGRALLNQARSMMGTALRNTVRRRAEQRARNSLAALASALNWAEDYADEQSAHEEMDEAGKWVRETFGCVMTQRGDRYFDTCPVSLGHRRVGFSVGGRARKICSLCGDDLSECPHLRGTAYLVPGGYDDLGWCRVCLKRDECKHRADLEYRVSVVSIIQEMELKEVSIVSRPADPNARLHEIPVDHETLRGNLGPTWLPGQAVSCDQCLTPCAGLEQFPGVHG